MDSQFFYLKKIIKPKSDVQVELLRPRRFFRDQDRPNWLMSHFDVICVIWHHLRHLMSNDAYDIKIWHKSILPILVSKVALGPQLYNLWVRFGLRNCYKMKNFEIAYIIFFLYKFWKSFVFLPSSRSERAVTPRPPRVKCIVLLFFLCPYATFKILFIIIGGEMSFSHRPST